MVEKRNSTEGPGSLMNTFNPNNNEEALSKYEADFIKLKARQSQRLEAENAAVNSQIADHQSLISVLDGLSSQILRVRQHVDMIKSQPLDKAQKHQTFGPDENLSSDQLERIAQIIGRHKGEKSVPLDHALVLTKHLVEVKTQNMSLETQILELQAQLKENSTGQPTGNSSI